MTYHKKKTKQKRSGAGKRVEKLEPLSIAAGNVEGAASVEQFGASSES